MIPIVPNFTWLPRPTHINDEGRTEGNSIIMAICSSMRQLLLWIISLFMCVIYRHFFHRFPCYSRSHATHSFRVQWFMRRKMLAQIIDHSCEFNYWIRHNPTARARQSPRLRLILSNFNKIDLFAALVIVSNSFNRIRSFPQFRQLASSMPSALPVIIIGWTISS